MIVAQKSKTILRYEPLLKYLYIFGFFTVHCIVLAFQGNPVGYVLIFMIVELVLTSVHFMLRGNILAIINEEGIYINCTRLIKWEEIVSWTYYPGGRIPIQNRLEIITDIGNKFVIEGFSYLKVVKWLETYVPDKGKGIFSLRFLEDYLRFRDTDAIIGCALSLTSPSVK